MTDSMPGSPPWDQRGGPPGWGAAPPPPPPPPPAGSSRPLVRSSTDRRIAGVCGGIGAHFGVSSFVVRLLFVLLTFTGGVGILLYIVALVLMPEEGQAQPMGLSSLGWSFRGSDGHTFRIILAAVLLIVAVSLLADSLGLPHGGFVWGVGLVGIGVLLLVQDRRAPVPLAQPVAAPNPRPSYGAGAFGGGVATPTAVTPRWQRTRTPRRRSPLGLATLAAALLAVGVALLLDSAGVISLSVGMGLAIALLVVGVGLLIGTWFGRSRGLAVLGVLLLPCAAVASLVDVPLSGGTGTVSFSPQLLSDVQAQYHLAAGDLTVDLTQLAVSADRTVTVTVGLGRLRVLVPAPADVVVTAHAGAGHINLFGAFDDGVNIGSSAQSTPTVGGSVLHLTVNVGLGEIDVVRSSPATGSGG